MVNENQELQYHNSNILGVLLGVLIGGLVGAVTMILLAPQSGKETRTQIQKKGTELRDRTAGMMQDTAEQIRSEGNKIVVEGRQRAQDFAHQGKMLVARQLGHVSEAATDGKKAIESA